MKNNYKFKLTPLILALALLFVACSSGDKQKNPLSEITETTVDSTVVSELIEHEESVEVPVFGEILEDGDVINSERLAFRDPDTGLYGISDKDGNIIVEAIYEGLETHIGDENAENLIIAGHRNNGQIYLLDQDGNLHIDIFFDSFGIATTDYGAEMFVATRDDFEYWIVFEGYSGHGIEGEKGYFVVVEATTTKSFDKFDKYKPRIEVSIPNNDLSVIDEGLILAERAIELFIELSNDYDSAITKILDPKVEINNFENYGDLTLIYRAWVQQPGSDMSVSREEFIDKYAPPSMFYEDVWLGWSFNYDNYRVISIKAEYSNLDDLRNIGIEFLKNENGEWEILGVCRICGD
jgi:hypothetical protein